MQTVKVGQVWRDNYGLKYDGQTFTATQYTRYVKVLAVGAEDAQIQRCNQDGGWIPQSPARLTKLKRFNNTKSGFTLVKDVS
jgi:hypothetical protein